MNMSMSRAQSNYLCSKTLNFEPVDEVMTEEDRESGQLSKHNSSSYSNSNNIFANLSMS